MRAEIAGLERLARDARRRVRARARSVRGGARPADRDRDRQERPCRAQDRRDAGLDRQAGAVRPCGGSQPRRSRHDRRRGRDPRLVEFRRERRAGRHHRLFAPLRDPADRDHRRPELDAGAGRRCRAAAAGRGRGVPDGVGADDLDDDDDGARRRAGDRAVGAQRVFIRRFPAFPSRRPARPRPVAGRRHHAFGRRGPAGVAADCRCRKRSS